MECEAKHDAKTRQMRQELRDYLVEKGLVGFRCQDIPIKHRAVSPKDARRGNLVVLDVRSANNMDDCILGPWEKQFMIGLVKKRPNGKGSKENHKDDMLEIQMYEPYFYDKKRQVTTTTPMWVAIEKKEIDPSECSLWPYLLGCSWLPITQMPLKVHKALFESNGELYQAPKERNITKNFKDSGVDVVLLGKEGYVDKQKASTIKFVMQLDNAEKPNAQSAGSVALSPETREELMREMLGVIHK